MGYLHHPSIAEIDGQKWIMIAICCTTCDICNELMLPTQGMLGRGENDLESQAERIGIVGQSNWCDDDQFICKNCIDNGNYTISCYICRQNKVLSGIQKVIETDTLASKFYFCNDCYKSVSAAEWEKQISEAESYL